MEKVFHLQMLCSKTIIKQWNVTFGANFLLSPSRFPIYWKTKSNIHNFFPLLEDFPQRIHIFNDGFFRPSNNSCSVKQEKEPWTIFMSLCKIQALTTAIISLQNIFFTILVDFVSCHKHQTFDQIDQRHP